MVSWSCCPGIGRVRTGLESCWGECQWKAERTQNYPVIRLNFFAPQDSLPPPPLTLLLCDVERTKTVTFPFCVMQLLVSLHSEVSFSHIFHLVNIPAATTATDLQELPSQNCQQVWIIYPLLHANRTERKNHYQRIAINLHTRIRNQN